MSAATSDASPQSTAAGWHSLATALHKRAAFAAVVLGDGRVLVAGGVVDGELVPSAELYSPILDVWTETGPMVAPVFWPTAALLKDGRVLVVGGTGDGDKVVATAQIYDPKTGRWTRAPDMSSPRAGHTETVLTNGEVLVAGGTSALNGSSVLRSAELYHPATNNWTATGAMILNRADHSATLLPDGRVLVAGGGLLYGTTSGDGEIYDPATGRWADAGGCMGTPGAGGVTKCDSRANFAAVGLADGRVLVAGGEANEGRGDTLASAWLYDERTSSWLPAGHMGEARYKPAAALLPDGKVLVVGGRSSDGSALASAELFDPKVDTWSPAPAMVLARADFALVVDNAGEVLALGGSSGPATSPYPLRAVVEAFDGG